MTTASVSASFDCPYALVDVLLLRHVRSIAVLEDVPGLAIPSHVEPPLLKTGHDSVSDDEVGRVLMSTWAAHLRWRADTGDAASGIETAGPVQPRLPRSLLVGLDVESWRAAANELKRSTLAAVMQDPRFPGELMSDGAWRRPPSGTRIDVLPLVSPFEVEVTSTYRVTDVARWTAPPRPRWRALLGV